MKAEARRSFRHGFNLTEQELRRIVDTASQQMKRVSQEGKEHLHLEAKLKNGTIMESSSVDEVLSWENAGSKRIIGLAIDLADSEDRPKFVVHMHFADIDQDDDVLRAVNYVVRGEDRDWVLVTSSELEERVARVKCFAWSEILGGTRGRVLAVVLAPLTAILIMFLLIHFSIQPNNTAELIETRWRAGTLHDPIEAIILVEKAARTRETGAGGAVARALLYPVAILAGFFLVAFAATYLYPAYVFCWGDNTRAYERRLSARKWVFGVVVTGLVLSILASIIVARMGWDK